MRGAQRGAGEDLAIDGHDRGDESRPAGPPIEAEAGRDAGLLARPRLPRRNRPQPAHPIGYAEARPKGRASIRARLWRPRSPSPHSAPRKGALNPPTPSRASPPKRKLIKVGGRGRSVGSRCALRACGRRNQRLCGLHCRALSWGRSAPHAPGSRLRAGGRAVGAHRPTQPGSAGNRTSAQACAARSALPAPPPLVCASRPAPSSRIPPAGGSAARGIRAPAAWAASAHLRCRAPRLGTSSRGSSGSRVACSGRIVGPGVAARLSPAQLAGPAGFPFLLHFFAFQLANVCSIWYNCIGRFCL